MMMQSDAVHALLSPDSPGLMGHGNNVSLFSNQSFSASKRVVTTKPVLYTSNVKVI